MKRTLTLIASVAGAIILSKILIENVLGIQLGPLIESWMSHAGAGSAATIVARSEVVGVDDIGGRLGESQGIARAEGNSALERAVRGALHDRLVQAGAGASVYHDIVERVESQLVSEALTITNGNQVKAADILGVNRATLRKKMPAEE